MGIENKFQRYASKMPQELDDNKVSRVGKIDPGISELTNMI
jgi:hypothetical protein